jgi:hypothetical protein
MKAGGYRTGCANRSCLRAIRDLAEGLMAQDDTMGAARAGRLGLLGANPAADGAGDPDMMRALLNGLLAEARAAKAMPWPPLNARLYRMLFPQLAGWLPEEEGAKLRREFEAELARLEAA